MRLRKKEPRNKRRTHTPPSIKVKEAEEVSPSKNTYPAQNVKLQYIIYGLLGELEINVMRTQQILVDSLNYNLKQDQQDEDTKTKRKIMQYKRRRINDVYVWLPTGVSANMSHYLSEFLKTKLPRSIK
jgi:hypothetical protein